VSAPLLVLGEHDVRRLLSMEDCIEAMAEVLEALARDELDLPLRSVMRPADGSGFFGLMPAHRGGDAPAYALKEIVITPANSARGLDPHQGAVLLHDGGTGYLTAVLNASPITEIRTAAVSAVATRLLARPGSKRVAVLGAGVQGRSHVAAMRAVLEEPEFTVWSRSRERGEALGRELGVAVAASAEEAVAGADVVCTTTSSPEPVLSREWLAPGVHVNAVGSSIPTTRELDTATMVDASLFVDRRESTVNESGDYLIPLAAGAIGPEHIRAELGELLTGAHPGRASDDELTVFKSLGIAVEDLAAAELVVRRAREAGAGVEVDF
jgi:ornithine cyclodeaminase